MRKKVKPIIWSWLLFLSIILIFHCQTAPSLETKKDSAYTISVEPETGRISLNAENASLFEIVKELKAKYQIEVILPNVSTDRTVSVAFSDKPLNEGLAALIPEDLKYRFRTPNIETAIQGSTGDKKTPVSPKLKPRNLPAKDQTNPLRPQQKTIIKSKPFADASEKHTQGEKGTKTDPRRSVGKIGKGNKIPKKRAQEKYQYARLNFFIDSDNKIRIERIIKIEGRLIESSTYNGRFLYSAFIDNNIVAVGSMQDPLLVRSLGDQPGRLTTRAKHGYFSISLPDVFLNKEKLARGKVNFYLLEDDSGMPERITPQTFLKFEKRLKATVSIGSDELLKIFPGNR